MNSTIRLRGAIALLLGLFLCIAPCGRSAATIIDTTVAPSLGTFCCFGEPGGNYVADVQTFGQTFETPNATETRLDNFSFLLFSLLGGPQKLHAYVMQWEQATAQTVGPVLFQSAVQELLPGSHSLWVSIDTGGLNLASATDYVAFFSITGLLDGVMDISTWVIADQNLAAAAYPSGRYVRSSYPYGEIPPGGWFCRMVNSSCALDDLGFKMSFQGLPEPGSVAIFGAVLAALGITTRRAKRLLH